MELVSYASSAAVVAFVVSKLYEVIQAWYYSDPVQQVVNMTLVLRDSLHPLVINAAKHIVIIIAKTLHLVIHVAAQVLITFKHIYTIGMMAGKGLFVALRSFNDAFDFIWSFPETYLNPFIDWLFTHPVPTYTWRITLLTVLALVYGFYALRRVLKKEKQVECPQRPQI